MGMDVTGVSALTALLIDEGAVESMKLRIVFSYMSVGIWMGDVLQHHPLPEMSQPCTC